MTPRRLAGTAAVLLALLPVGAAAALIGEPLAFPNRGALAAFAALAAAGLVAGTRRPAPSLAAAALAAWALWAWSAPWRDARAVWADPAAARVAGRHFVVGYDDVAEVRELSRAGLIGGVFLTRRNVAGRTAAAVAAEVAGLQEDRRRAGLPPLLVAADQEGGPVDHLSPPLPPVPALSLLAGLPAEARRGAARQEGVAAGRALAGLGVTMDLAPVADLRPASSSGMLDLHTRIASRAASDDPAVAADLVGGALSKPVPALEAADWVPFRAVLAVQESALMVSHASLEAVDPGVPASRSRAVVQGLLRGAWRFGGVVVTDDLTMGAAVHPGLCRGVEGALAAGVDLLLVSWDTDRIYPALRCSADAVRAGRIDRAMLRRSDARLDVLAFHEKMRAAGW